MTGAGAARSEPILLCLVATGDADGDSDALCWDLLSAEERARIAAIACPSRRRQRLLSRALLRRITASLSGRPARDIRIVGRSGAKPRFGDGVGIDFSVSHSSDRIALAFSRAGEVGCDIERLRDRPLDSFAANCCGRAEKRRLAGLDRTRGRNFLFSRWTLKEALLKATGEGLSHPMPAIELAELPSAGRGAREYSCRHGESEWRLWNWTSRSFSWSLAACRGDARVRTLRAPLRAILQADPS